MLVNGIGLPYFPVFLSYLHFSDTEIGLILAMPHLVRMAGTALGSMAADRAQERTTILVWSGGLSLLTAIALYFVDGFWPVLILYSLQGIVYAPYVPVVEAVLITGVRRWRFDYGRLRLWGSGAFILSNLLGGLLYGWFGGAMVLPAMAAFFVLTIAMGVAAPRLGRIDPDRAAMLGRSRSRNPLYEADFLLVIMGASMIHGSHGMLFGFATNYWTGLGFSGNEIGLLWATGVLSEIALFAISGRLMARYSVWMLILTGAAVTLLRWLLFPVPTGLGGHLALQALHAFTFATVHVGVQKLLMLRVGERQEASAQGLYTTFTALFNAVTALSSGWVLQHYGAQGFFLMAVIAAVAIVLVGLARMLQPQRPGSGG